MWNELLSEWLGLVFLALLKWVMFAMLIVAGVAAGIVYLIMK